MGVSIINHAAVPALFFVLLRLYYAQNNASLIFAGLVMNHLMVSIALWFLGLQNDLMVPPGWYVLAWTLILFISAYRINW